MPILRPSDARFGPARKSAGPSVPSLLHGRAERMERGANQQPSVGRTRGNRLRGTLILFLNLLLIAATIAAAKLL